MKTSRRPRSPRIAVAVAAVLATAHAPIAALPAHATTPTCPSAVGAFALDVAHSQEGPEFGFLDCDYDASEGEVLELTVAWTPSGTGQTNEGGPCDLPHDPSDTISDTHDAYVVVSRSPDVWPEWLQAAIDGVTRPLLAVVESVAEPCTSSGTTTTSTVPATPGKSLCAEAVALLEGFSAADLQAAGVSVDHTNLNVDGRSLTADIEQAIREYDATHPDDRAYVTWGTPFAGELGAMSWLFSYGGAIGGPVARAYVTGVERKLQDRIVARAERLGSAQHPQPLTPGDVFELALDINGGSANQALLTAHNLMRGAFRNDAVSAPGITYDNGAYLSRYLMELRGGGPDADTGGPWYHLFGTAYAEVTARGDWGPLLTAGGAAAAFAAGLLSGPAALVLGGLAIAWQNESDTSGTTGASRLFNGFEQLVRELNSSQKPDPEKFCFNIWGARIGAVIYEGLPLRGTQGSAGPFSGFEPPSEPVPHVEPAERLRNARYVNGVGSPFAVQWRSGTMEMLLDQGPDMAGAQLYGGVPTWLFPVIEDASWGVVWISPTNSGETITLEATTDRAPLTFVRTDARTGDTAYYEVLAAHAGDRFKVSLDPATLAPPMTAESDGTTIDPRVVSLDIGDDGAGDTGGEGSNGTAGSSSPPTIDAPDAGASGDTSGSGIGLSWILATLAVAGVAVAFEVRRRRSAPSVDDA